MRPDEGGRQVLVRLSADGGIDDLVPDPISVRTRVHEYGGGAYVVRDGVVVYVNFADQRLYRMTAGSDARPLTPEPPRPASLRYADMQFLPDGRLLCVRETHPSEGEAVNELVTIPADGSGEVIVVASGREFYASPRLAPDGSTVCWLEWDHPNMPWDGSELKVAALDGSQIEGRVIAGGAAESIAEPSWAADGALVFMSDRSGWWNPYRYDGTTASTVLSRDIEFANPAWVFHSTSYGFLSEGRILAAYWDGGRHRLALIDGDGFMSDLDLAFSRYSALVTNGDDNAWAVVQHPTRPSAIVEIDVGKIDSTSIRSNPASVNERYQSEPRLISFPTTNGDTAHGVYYPPTNPEFIAPDAELPPLIVEVHGGPTSCVTPRFAVGYLYWTSRGFGVVDVNYRGSSGFGRVYREKLEGQWGVADVDDCLAAAQHLVENGEADPDRLLITGGSAGGYTTLAALAFRDGFSGGASYYGVADLALLAAHTHKFESRYLDRLVRPEDFESRSPLNHVEGITSPVVLFQGLEDRVVPPGQARAIADALRENGVPYAQHRVRGRRPRLPKSREHHPQPGDRACVLRQGARLHADRGPSGRAACRREVERRPREESP